VTDDLLRELADKRALDDMIFRAALALDKRDWPAYRSCLADGAVHFDFTAHTDRVVGKHVGVETNPDRWVEKLAAIMPGFDGSQHLITNTVHSVQGDAAESECFILADHFLNNDVGDRSIAMGGIYTFRSIRAPAGWRIQRWHLRPLWYRGNPGLYQIAAEKAAKLK
jgi:hypothetical protein